MQLADFDFLLSPRGQQWLAELAQVRLTERTHLQWAMRLRKDVSQTQAHALLETAMLRQRAAVKFSRAGQMYFDRQGLEMSSAELISTYRAQKFAPFARVADLGCGIGGDALGLAQHCHVTAVDQDALRLAMVLENARAYGRMRQVETRQADLNGLGAFSAEALFFDPARRDEFGRRIHTLARYRPPLSILDRWAAQTAHWGIKVSPAVDLAEIPKQASVEFISVKGELREAVLWYGVLRSAARTTATLLPAGEQLDSNAPHSQIGISSPKRYIFEPDAALIRAQLVQHVATRLGAQMLDKTIAYLTGDHAVESSLVKQFIVEAWFPFQLKRLRGYLRERGVGKLTIKKRGSPLDPDQLRQQLKPRGSEQRTLILTRHAGKPIVIICL
ncbi:MAG TPA: class I SAM-dependent methyltransferase [Anaerolineae bacterium]|nr:class I SAM-dependent methyltransferase [Anaerolineae bacterium]